MVPVSVWALLRETHLSEMALRPANVVWGDDTCRKMQEQGRESRTARTKADVYWGDEAFKEATRLVVWVDQGRLLG